MLHCVTRNSSKRLAKKLFFKTLIFVYVLLSGVENHTLSKVRESVSTTSVKLRHHLQIWDIKKTHNLFNILFVQVSDQALLIIT